MVGIGRAPPRTLRAGLEILVDRDLCLELDLLLLGSHKLSGEGLGLRLEFVDPLEAVLQIAEYLLGRVEAGAEGLVLCEERALASTLGGGGGGRRDIGTGTSVGFVLD